VKIGIISDIHSNFEALTAVLSALEKENVERVICLGDLVGYGPDPNACVELVLNSADFTVAGNHDRGATGSTPIGPFNQHARTAIEWTRTLLEPRWMSALSSLQLVYEESAFLAVHATPNFPDEWHYLFSKDEIVDNLEALTLPVCFVGHSHVPMAFELDPEHAILIRPADEVRFQPGWKYLINVGSVGQPRDGDPRAAYGVLSDGVFTLKREAYDVPTVQGKMRNAGLPAPLIERLSAGQ
jgi:predicted phosphodiesterase